MGMVEGTERGPPHSRGDRPGTRGLDVNGMIPEDAAMANRPEAGVAPSNDDSRHELNHHPSRGGNPAEMVNALDALRVASTFFVLLYHAALAYMATPLRLTTWVAYDASHHVA